MIDVFILQFSKKQFLPIADVKSSKSQRWKRNARKPKNMRNKFNCSNNSQNNLEKCCVYLCSVVWTKSGNRITFYEYIKQINSLPVPKYFQHMSMKLR